MAGAVPESVLEALNAVDGALSLLEGLLPEVWAGKEREERELPPVEAARLNLALAKTAATLFGMYLRTKAVPVDSHPIKKELERLQLYEAKVGKAVEKRSGPRAPTVALNVAAANRFIDRAIPDLTLEQRKRLFEVRSTRSTIQQQRASKRPRPSAKDSALEFLERAKAELKEGPNKGTGLDGADEC